MIKSFFSRFFRLYTESRLPMAAAALSYYITMTFFPIVICIYTMLGNSYDKMLNLLELLSRVLPERSVDYVERFLDYVSDNYSILMMLLALSVIVFTSSAAFRCVEMTVGQMQGGKRFEGYAFFLVSILISLVFLAVIYSGIIVMFFGENLINYLNEYVPYIRIKTSVSMLKYGMLFCISLVILIMVFELCKRKEDRYSTFWGALFSTTGLVAVSILFSLFFNASVKYPLVYGSLASIILLMFWLYSCSLVIFCGAAINITVRDIRAARKALGAARGVPGGNSF